MTTIMYAVFVVLVCGQDWPHLMCEELQLIIGLICYIKQEKYNIMYSQINIDYSFYDAFL